MKVARDKPLTIPAVRPNEGLRESYQTKLERLVDDMHASLLWWLRAQYRANTPEMAQDDSPAVGLQKAIAALTRQWQGKFNDAAPRLGRWFAQSSAERTDKSLQAILKRSGFSVAFKLTRQQNDVLQATTGENVNLISNLAEKHLFEINGLVMRSVAQGRDLATLTDQLEQRYQITRRRAAFIARDQNNKATATVTRVRQDELGITEAAWRHSRGAKHPRPSHLAADGKTYKIAEGMYLDGKWVWPGTEPNCGCLSRSIIPGRVRLAANKTD